MLGDDLNATVMTERVGFGTGFGRAREGVLCIVQRGSDGRTTKERLVSKGTTKATGRSGNYERMQVFFKKNDGNEVPMQCG